MRELIDLESGARRQIASEGTFHSFVILLSVILVFYLIWPVENWVEGISALFGGFIGGAFLGGFILSSGAGRAFARLIGHLLKVAVLIAALGALLYIFGSN